VEEVLVASVIAFDVNETLLDLGALDAPFAALLGSAALRPQWFQLMLQLALHRRPDRPVCRLHHRAAGRAGHARRAGGRAAGRR
jgi:hypothetical protein